MADPDDMARMRYDAAALWKRGKNTQEIANALGVSEAFVFNHKLHRRPVAAQQEKSDERMGP